MDYFDKMLWAYRAVVTQANVAGGSLRLNIAPQERTLFLFGAIGKDDYAADRNVEMYISDGTNTIGRGMYLTAADNEHFPIFTDAEAAVVANKGLQLEKQLLLGKGDILSIQAASLVQNETLTVALRALINAIKPTVTTTGSGGTPTIVETYNKVI